jgi:hypothetical protein
MKKLVVGAALAALIATPAFAASARHQTRAASDNARAAFAQDIGGVDVLVRDPATVIVNGRYIGRDPDPRIRFELMRDADVSQY